MEHIKNYVQENKERFINELKEKKKIPSVSADSAFSQDVLNTAEKAALALGELKEDISIVLNRKEIYNNNPVIYIPSSINIDKKIKINGTLIKYLLFYKWGLYENI